MSGLFSSVISGLFIKNMQPTIKSKLIQGAKPEAETLRKIQEQSGIPVGISINLMVYEIDYDRKKFYCCWSGGEFRNGQPHCTLIGQAAMEALANLPIGDQKSFIFQELKLGPTPLRDKIKATLKKSSTKCKNMFYRRHGWRTRWAYAPSF